MPESSIVKKKPLANSIEVSSQLTGEELRKIDAYWRACNYLSVGMIYLCENPLLRKPLKPEHIKHRLLGHWGSDPGQSFIWVHLNRLIKKYDLNVMYISGPGHGAPATLANCYLEGHYSEIYPDKSRDEAGLLKFFRQFSFPGGIGSHCTPETPGSIHEGGELGYSISHAYGAAFDNPDLIVTVVVGDGEAETGPLATSWHSNKFLNPIRDGVVLPVLHLNGYKIANPTILARIPHEELESLLIGYGHKPYFVEGDDPATMHQEMASTLERCILEIRSLQQQARTTGDATRPRWPMIVLRSPKGWTGPKEVDGHKVEGTWRAHQVPILDAATNKQSLRMVEDWMRSYKPEELFDANGTLVPELQDLAPSGTRRVSANPHANGGLLRKELELPDFREYALNVKAPGATYVSPTDVLAHFLAEVMRRNMNSFRVFGPDETASNKLTAIYAASKKTWLAEYKPEDADGGELDVAGRVMEMLSEHTLEGWFEGYVLTGRHGLLSSYEAFIHIIDSMFNQHAKWLEKSKKELSWRAPIPSINILITSLVWRQDHNGFTHQDPGFLDVVTNKSPDVVRIYLPPDANCLLSVADHCLRSRDYVNVIVADKQEHLQYLSMEDAVKHCTKGIGIWDWASTDDGEYPDVVIACAGDIATMESLAAVAMLKEYFPDLKIRFVNVVDLFRLMPESEHPHGLSDRDFDSLFTTDKPVIFNFHSYASLIHKLSYRRKNHDNIHVRGYKEKGNINTPLELAILNQIDRFDLAIDVIDRVPRLRSIGAHVKEWLKGQIIESVNYAHAQGIDKEEIRNWKWPGVGMAKTLAKEDGPILVLNSGSSSLKFGIYRPGATDEEPLLNGSAEGIGRKNGALHIRSSDGTPLLQRDCIHESQKDALASLAAEIKEHIDTKPVAVGHRVVHGGPKLCKHQVITPQVLEYLRTATHFAPLHIPQALTLIATAQSTFPSATQFACFDDAFHQTIPEVASHLPLPQRYFDAGIRRYGFHGISYESLVHHFGAALPQRAIFAHLGNGSSLCALRNGMSIDTTMGLTPTGGIPMATRSGDLDPGVIIYLMRSERLDVDSLEELLNRQGGLFALSSGEGDVKALEERARANDSKACLALDVFSVAVRKTIGAYIALLGGADLLVFTGGIGEHSDRIRSAATNGLEALGLTADKIQVVPTQEERQIARHCREMMIKDRP